MKGVKTHQVKFECEICGKEYPDKTRASKCFTVHSQAINKLIAGYKPGARMKTYFLGNIRYSLSPVTIIKADGELTGFRVLVEAEGGERWWVNVVSFESGQSIASSIQNKPTHFWTRHPLAT